MGPPGMPAEAVAYYEGMLQRMSRSPGWQKFLSSNQLDDAFLRAKETTAFLGEFEDQLRKILVQGGVKLVR
jgi:putative tricarboxylic transport membrane protein